MSINFTPGFYDFMILPLIWSKTFILYFEKKIVRFGQIYLAKFAKLFQIKSNIEKEKSK
jgi:hypothetical protein